MSILTIVNKKIEVKAIEGDNQLGGQDVDQCLCEFFIEKIKSEHEYDITKGKNGSKNVQKLRDACSQAKILLTNAYTTEVIAEGILED